MPIIPMIGRRSLKMRSLIIFVYAVLIIGSFTTVYPFMIMLATSVSSKTDYEEYRVIPRFLTDDKALFAKYLEEKERYDLFEVFKLRYHLEEPYQVVISGETVTRKYGRFTEMRPVFVDFDTNAPELKAKVADWMDFKKTLPLPYMDTYFHSYGVPVGEVEVAFQKFLKSKYPTLELLRPALGEGSTFAYIDVQLPFEAYDRHGWYPGPDQKSKDWVECRATLLPRQMNPMTVLPLYQKAVMEQYATIEAANAAWGTTYRYFWQIPFAHARPAGPEGKDWEEFVRKRMPMRYARLDVDLCRPSYVAYLKANNRDVDAYNGKMNDNATSFETAGLSDTMPQTALALWNWQAYYENNCPIEAIAIDSPDRRWEKFLSAKYGDLAALNAAYKTNVASFASVEPPWREEDAYDLATRKSEIKMDYLTRNYVYVTKRVFLQGRALFNTFVLVFLVVFTQVTVNPLAAYALSRYRLSYTGKVLVFMLATMAFPAEVAMIPNFLLIKNLGLLNTFAALILPGLANGYYVFLLKGFFDSLPSELYEAASIDGASELRMFVNITLPLSLPVLSVIALFAFGGAYGSFLWALTTCQDPKMWTLMVFLQQFQIQVANAPYVIMAALALAAVPTIVVFLSAQKVLMKGIVVPTMK